MGRKPLAQPTLPDLDRLAPAPTGEGGCPGPAPGAGFKHSPAHKCASLSAFPLEAIFQAAVNRKPAPLTASSISLCRLFLYG